jgi:hypothetical protein
MKQLLCFICLVLKGGREGGREGGMEGGREEGREGSEETEVWKGKGGACIHASGGSEALSGNTDRLSICLKPGT